MQLYHEQSKTTISSVFEENLISNIFTDVRYEFFHEHQSDDIFTWLRVPGQLSPLGETGCTVGGGGGEGGKGQGK